MTTDEARHLLARTGFGPRPAEITQAAARGREAVIDDMLLGAGGPPVVMPPSWLDEPPPQGNRRDRSEEERRRMARERRRQGRELKAWWFEQMVATPSPLTERMTLFWHNHFTSSLRKCRFPPLLYRQNALYRREGLGSFRRLLHAVAADPAMILYLDNQSNRAGAPNENFARELLELFTLGEGNYEEADIKEAARAFTGWMVDRRTGEFRFNPRRHDDGEKTFMGRRGRLGGEDILDTLLENERTSVFIVEKLWRAFVSPDPDPVQVDELARLFRQTDYSIAAVLRAMLLTDALNARSSRGVFIKSPVDLIVGTLRVFQAIPREPMGISRFSAALGQDLFDPPNVKGWPGGDRWITSATLLRRQQLLTAFVRGRDIGGGRRSDGGMDRMDRRYHREQIEGWIDGLWAACGGTTDGARSVLLPLPPVEPVAAGDGRAAIAGILLDPVYQLT